MPQVSLEPRRCPSVCILRVSMYLFVQELSSTTTTVTTCLRGFSSFFLNLVRTTIHSKALFALVPYPSRRHTIYAVKFHRSSVFSFFFSSSPMIQPASDCHEGKKGSEPPSRGHHRKEERRTKTKAERK